VQKFLQAKQEGPSLALLSYGIYVVLTLLFRRFFKPVNPASR
jgi:hypothetical protein